MARTSRSTIQSAERTFFRTVAGLLVLVLVALLYLVQFGFPRWLVEACLDRLDTGRFALETGAIHLDLLSGLDLRDVRVYRKGIIGPPAVEAEGADVALDPLGLLRAGGVVRRVRIRDGEVRLPMLWSAEGDARRDRETAVRGGTARVRVELLRCRVHGVEVERFGGNVFMDGLELRLQDFRGRLGRGARTGTFAGRTGYNAGTRVLSGSVNLECDPHVFLPLLEACNYAGHAEIVRRFDFDRAPPEFRIEFTRVCTPTGATHVECDMRGRDLRYRGVDVLGADGTVRVDFSPEDSLTTVRPLLIVRREGTVRGGFTMQSAERTVDFDAVATIDPQALRSMLGILASPLWDRCEFGGAARIEAAGRVGRRGTAQTDFRATMSGRGLTHGRWEADRYSFDMAMRGRTNWITNIRAQLYDGELAGRARFVLPRPPQSNTAYAVACTLADIDFEQAMRIVAGEEESDFEGRLSARLSVEGLLGEANRDTAKGECAVTIDDGRVFMLPIFGGLSRLLTRVIPGLNFVLRQSDAHAEFVVADGRLTAEKMRVEGDVLSLSGRGGYSLDGDLDFHVQVKLMKEHSLVAQLVRVLTYPISKLFEFRLRGTVQEPRWYPENFSTDLLEKLGLRDKRP